jgi:hypothetical protein
MDGFSKEERATAWWALGGLDYPCYKVGKEAYHEINQKSGFGQLSFAGASFLLPVYRHFSMDRKSRSTCSGLASWSSSQDGVSLDQHFWKENSGTPFGLALRSWKMA